MYYMIINGEQRGPYELDDLRSQGMTADTMMWRAGMSDWMPASQIEELKGFFCAPRINLGKVEDVGRFEPRQTEYVAQQPYQHQQPYREQSYQQPYRNEPYQPSYQQPYQGGYGTRKRSKWMAWAITCTVLGLCNIVGLILGIIAISKASTANNFYTMGNDMLGDSSDNSAKTLCIVGLIFDAMSIFGWLLYVVFLGYLLRL